MELSELMRVHEGIGDLREFLYTPLAQDMYDINFIDILVRDLNDIQENLAKYLITGKV